MISDVVKITLPAIIAFCIGIIGTPILTFYLYKYEMWKKSSVAKTLDGGQATLSSKLHNDEIRRVPRMGGIIVWGSTVITILLFALVSYILPIPLFQKISFLSRSQTWLLLFTLIVTSLIGLVDDYLVCNKKGTYVGGGLSLIVRLSAVTSVGLVGAWWFVAKLGFTIIYLPVWGNIQFGLWFIPLFVILMIGIYSGGIIDGIDGLAGGIFSSMYTAYALIAFLNNQIDIAAFCMAIAGGLLAFLWFNIPPARFFLSETGTMGLTTTLVVIAFMTNAVFVLPIIALPLIVTTLSSILQIASKKLRHGKKIFLVAPLHNHFQQLGWPPYKVTMRYWIVSLICSITGVILILIF